METFSLVLLFLFYSPFVAVIHSSLCRLLGSSTAHRLNIRPVQSSFVPFDGSFNFINLVGQMPLYSLSKVSRLMSAFCYSNCLRIHVRHTAVHKITLSFFYFYFFFFKYNNNCQVDLTLRLRRLLEV